MRKTLGLSVAVQNGLFGIDTHAAAEVWLPEMGRWIYEDPTFNCYWKIDGKPASAMLLHCLRRASDVGAARREIMATHSSAPKRKIFAIRARECLAWFCELVTG